jgi:peptidylprolyl isomerase
MAVRVGVLRSRCGETGCSTRFARRVVVDVRYARAIAMLKQSGALLCGVLALQSLVACGTAPVGADGGTDVPSSGADASGGGRYAPMGFTVTAELSATPVRMFNSAMMVLEPNKDYAAVIETDVPGRIVIDLTETQTPITVNSFVFLARNHFYDGIAFHRVLEGFVAQGGDPKTLSADRAMWGTGGCGYMFGLEIDPTLNFNSRGVLGMARAMSPDSNGSQFYLTLAPTPGLNNMYTVFGRIIEGDSVLDGIARNMSMNSPPAVPTRMTSVYIVERSR